MRLQRQSNRMLIEFNPAAELGVGGEARVFLAPPDGKLVAKVYHRPGEAYAAKLAVMLANPPDDPMDPQGHVSIAWPCDLLRSTDPGENNRQVVGFLMPRAEDTRPLYDYYNPRIRLQACPLFNYLYLLRTARNLASAVHAIHARGYVIGDINESNVLVTDTALVTIVDTDSFQVRDPQTGALYRCPVGKPDFTPAELQGETFREVDRTPEHDRFGLAVLLFLLLMEGTHPFAGSYTVPGDPPPYAERIRMGYFPYGTRPTVYRPMSVAPPFELIAPPVQELFLRCFEAGHDDPSVRPTAEEWVSVLMEAEEAMTTCSINDQHRYGSHLTTCPWCERRLRLAGRDPFPPREVVLRGDYIPPEKTASLKTHTYVLPISHKSSPYARASRRDLGVGRRLVIWSSIVVALVLCGVGLFAMVTRQNRRQEAQAAAQTARVQLSVLVKEEAGFQSGAIRQESAEATLQELKKMGEAAMQHVQRGLVLDGNSPEVLAARAETEAALRRVEADFEAQAARGLLDAVQNATGNPPDEITRRQQLAAALKHCQTALSLDPHNRPTWLQRIRALQLSGDAAAAQAELQQARILFPDDPALK